MRSPATSRKSSKCDEESSTLVLQCSSDKGHDAPQVQVAKVIQSLQRMAYEPNWKGDIPARIGVASPTAMAQQHRAPGGRGDAGRRGWFSSLFFLEPSTQRGK